MIWTCTCSQVPDHEVTQSFVEVESGKDDANRPMLQEALELARSTGQILLVSQVAPTEQGRLAFAWR